jgi:hypothetical protein
VGECELMSEMGGGRNCCAVMVTSERWVRRRLVVVVDAVDESTGQSRPVGWTIVKSATREKKKLVSARRRRRRRAVGKFSSRNSSRPRRHTRARTEAQAALFALTPAASPLRPTMIAKGGWGRSPVRSALPSWMRRAPKMAWGRWAAPVGGQPQREIRLGSEGREGGKVCETEKGGIHHAATRAIRYRSSRRVGSAE